MAVEYYFNNLNPVSFQKLINTLLLARFGEQIRLLPLRGKDGGRDAETAPGNLLFERPQSGFLAGWFPDKGRYLFQAKHHRTIDSSIATVRNTSY